jgi:hypothetical protein
MEEYKVGVMGNYSLQLLVSSFGFCWVQMSNTTNATNTTREIQRSKLKYQNKFKYQYILDFCSI